MRTERLGEYRTQSFALSAGQAHQLGSVPGLTVTRALDGEGYLVTTSSNVGMVVVDDLVFEIHPKIGIERTLFLVSYTLDRLSLATETAELRQAPSLVDAMATLFVAAARRALRPGVLQGYRTEEDALQVVRGRLRFDDQLRRRFGRFPPVEVRFDEYTVDIELNRLLRAAVTRLRHLPLRSGPLRSELRHLDHLLEEVSLVDYAPPQIPSPTFDRLTSRYRPAVQLARAVLRATSSELGHGHLESAAFLIDMNAVFEDFVVVALREHLGLSELEFPQNAKRRGLTLDEHGRIKLEPDLSWWTADRCVFVGDVKYKRIDVGPIKHADLYQLLAYLVATDLPAGLLVYAKGETTPTDHTIRHLGKRIEVVALDLGGDIDDVMTQVAELADRVRSLRLGEPDASLVA